MDTTTGTYTLKPSGSIQLCESAPAFHELRRISNIPKAAGAIVLHPFLNDCNLAPCPNISFGLLVLPYTAVMVASLVQLRSSLVVISSLSPSISSITLVISV